ncbi:hypothetical protein Psi02_24340 [Planotetraspora silvatica]|uniref:Uncharacterized protein n=1 Tax=Planotetraspora silvatica TaxID=234614 RepID=A0A8J3XM91_9ACTN|nr:hypothetical protein Psi02_24340 [Planotetraspora silvatica]
MGMAGLQWLRDGAIGANGAYVRRRFAGGAVALVSRPRLAGVLIDAARRTAASRRTRGGRRRHSLTFLGGGTYSTGSSAGSVPWEEDRSPGGGLWCVHER